MIPCICIDDKNRPADFPLSKWVKEDEQYRITAVYLCLPQKVLGYSLYEKPCGPECHPYQYFISTRFALTKEDSERVMQMFKDQGEAMSDKDLQELFKNSNLEIAQ